MLNDSEASISYAIGQPIGRSFAIAQDDKVECEQERCNTPSATASGESGQNTVACG